MKKIILALVLMTAPAFAQNSATLEQRGHWSSFVARTPSNSIVCGIDVIDPNDGRHFMIKWFQGSNRLMFHVQNPRWEIVPGRQLNVAFQVEGYENWSATATAINRQTLEWFVAVQNIGRFEMQFRYGHRMALRFPGTGENPWSISLLGTNAIVSSLVECMRSVGG